MAIAWFKINAQERVKDTQRYLRQDGPRFVGLPTASLKVAAVFKRLSQQEQRSVSCGSSYGY